VKLGIERAKSEKREGIKRKISFFEQINLLIRRK